MGLLKLLTEMKLFEVLNELKLIIEDRHGLIKIFLIFGCLDPACV